MISPSWQTGEVKEPARTDRNFLFGMGEGLMRSGGPDLGPQYLGHAGTPPDEEQISNTHETGRFPYT
jgi:hypothetical protein